MFFINITFSIIILIICICCIFNILFNTLLTPLYFKKKVQNEILKNARQLNQACSFYKSNEDNATFKLKIQDKTYLIKIIILKRNSDLQINNIDTFLVYNHIYKENCKFKKIANMSKFMKSKSSNRIIILANKAKTIQKVINECEMIMVNPNIDVYGTHILNFNQCSFLFDKKI